MTSKALIVGAVLLTAGLASAQETAEAQLRKQQEAATVRRIVEEQAVGARVPLEATPVTGAPYFAEFVSESVQVLADGNRIVRRSTGRVFRDSEGRTRREQDVEPGRAGHIAITDPVAKVSYSLDPETKIAWQTSAGTAVVIREAARAAAEHNAQVREKAAQVAADPAEVERRQKVEAEIVAQRAKLEQAATAGILRKVKPEWEEKVEKLDARQIEGVMAEGTRTTRTIPAGAIGNEQPIVTVTEEWRSPELHVLVLTQTKDPRTGESTYKLLSIARAEPNLSWFEVPADYTVKQTGVRRVVRKK